MAVTSEYHCLIKSLQLMKVMSCWSHREEKFFIVSCFSKFQVSDLASAGPKWRDTSYGIDPPPPPWRNQQLQYSILYEPGTCIMECWLSHTELAATALQILPLGIHQCQPGQVLSKQVET